MDTLVQKNLLETANKCNKKFVVFIGGGDLSAYAKSIIDLNKKYELLAICDDIYSDITYKNNLFLGPIDEIVNILKSIDNIYFCITIGSPKIRRNITQRIQIEEEKYINIIHPSAIIDSTVFLGKNIVIGPKCVIGSLVSLGSYTLVLTGAIVEHHTTVKEYVNIAPSVVICGGVSIGSSCYIGANATIIQYKSIGAYTIVGANSLVLSDIPSYVTCYGVPAKVKKIRVEDGIL